MSGFLKFDWWRDEDNRNGASAIIGVLKVVVPAALVVGTGALVCLGFGPEGNDKPPPTPSIVATNGSAVQTGDGTQIVQGAGGTVIIGFTIEQHQQQLAAREQQLRADLERAGAAERALIQQELDAVATKLVDLETSYQDTVEVNRQLRLQLEDLQGEVPTQKLEAAQKALFEGDRSLADDLFAEVEIAMADRVKQAASAAFGRGKIAAEEIRWADAAAHFFRAARLDPTYDHLFEARAFMWRSADYGTALLLGDELLDVANATGDQEKVAVALNEHALSLDAMGRYEEAEALYREALEIDRATIGEGHPSYAIRLNNLADLLVKQGKPDKARPLFEQALDIFQKTLPADHPHIAVVERRLDVLFKRDD